MPRPSRLAILTCVALATYAFARENPDACQSNTVISPHGELSVCFGQGTDVAIHDANSGKTWKIPTTACLTPSGIEGIDKVRIGLTCTLDDSLKAYLVLNAQNGQVEAKYAGLWFLWSPDRRTLAHIGVVQRYGTPEGNNYCLLFNERTVYPPNCTFEGKLAPTAHGHRPGKFAPIHTFYPDLAWSPDSQRLAFVEKTFVWEYLDPFNGYWAGTASDVHHYLVVAPATGEVERYSLEHMMGEPHVSWASDTTIDVGGQMFNLTANPPRPIRR